MRLKCVYAFGLLGLLYDLLTKMTAGLLGNKGTEDSVDLLYELVEMLECL